MKNTGDSYIQCSYHWPLVVCVCGGGEQNRSLSKGAGIYKSVLGGGEEGLLSSMEMIITAFTCSGYLC